MKRSTIEALSPAELRLLLGRAQSTDSEVSTTVREIFAEVSRNGDEALRAITKRFDGADLTQIEVSSDEMLFALQNVDPPVANAIKSAAANIKSFHQPQFPRTLQVKTAPGVVCSREWHAIERVGLYIPGGTAPLVSTVLMLAIPARIAGCREIILCTPPRADGSVSSSILFAAVLLDVVGVYKVGGAQAVAAMSIGTQTIPKVDKIFGPGNRYVAEAKAIASQPPYYTAVDLFAGPTELMVIADRTADPRLIASDLIAQAEHGEDSHVVLIALSAEVVDSVEREIAAQIGRCTRRATIERVLAKSHALIVASIDEAIQFSNRYAPEHLLLAVRDSEHYTPQIMNAGSVFLGAETSSVFGDYVSGTNHTLPTMGTARSSGGVTVESFMKSISFQTVSPEAASAIADTAATLANAEGLDGHANAAGLRKQNSGVGKWSTR